VDSSKQILGFFLDMEFEFVSAVVILENRGAVGAISKRGFTLIIEKTGSCNQSIATIAFLDGVYPVFEMRPTNVVTSLDLFLQCGQSYGRFQCKCE
jgi:hypothetical protein